MPFRAALRTGSTIALVRPLDQRGTRRSRAGRERAERVGKKLTAPAGRRAAPRRGRGVGHWELGIDGNDAMR